MPIIEALTIVQQVFDSHFTTLFRNAPQRKHCVNYLTGLLISPNKTVAGMTNEIPNASDQSYLNRFINDVDWVRCPGKTGELNKL